MFYLRVLLLFVLTLLFVFIDFGFAQPGLPSGPTQVPIDGGIIPLAAAGGYYAWRKLKNQETNEV